MSVLQLVGRPQAQLIPQEPLVFPNHRRPAGAQLAAHLAADLAAQLASCHTFTATGPTRWQAVNAGSLPRTVTGVHADHEEAASLHRRALPPSRASQPAWSGQTLSAIGGELYESVGVEAPILLSYTHKNE